MLKLFSNNLNYVEIILFFSSWQINWSPSRFHIIAILAGKLAALEEFRVQKEDLIAQVTSLEEELERQKQEHQAIIYNLERKAVLDNDRLRLQWLKMHFNDQHMFVVNVCFEFLNQYILLSCTQTIMEVSLISWIEKSCLDLDVVSIKAQERDAAACSSCGRRV